MGGVKLPREGEWRQQGVDQQGQETNTRARIRFLRLQQMFVGAKLLNISLVIIICPSKFGFSDKCFRFVMSVEKWCKSPPVSSEPFTTL